MDFILLLARLAVVWGFYSIALVLELRIWVPQASLLLFADSSYQALCQVIANLLAASGSIDIALMEVVTGLFRRLEFCLSGCIASTKCNAFARLARAAV